MSTKVKGEAIEDGSIPLSALENKLIKALQGFINIDDGFFLQRVDIDNKSMPSGDPLEAALEAFRSASSMTSYSYGKIAISRSGSYVLNGAYLKLPYQGKHHAYVMNTSGRIDYVVWKTTMTGLNFNTYEMLSDVTITKDVFNVTPDWNSQEGEAGYIKNKPLVSSIEKGTVYTFEGRLDLRDGNTIELDGRYIDWYEYTGVLEVYVGTPGNDYEYELVAKIIDIGVPFENNDIEIHMVDDGSFVFEFKMLNSAEEQNIAYKIISKLDYTPTIIHEDSIPNTIAREDESLRILRYISNPHIINMRGTPSERAIPKELYDAETDSFKMFGFSHDYPFVMIDNYGTVCPIYFDREGEQYIPRIWTVSGGASLIDISNGIVINIDLSH